MQSLGNHDASFPTRAFTSFGFCAEYAFCRDLLSRFAKGPVVDTLQNLRSFLAVSRAGSFSAAARKMGVATSVVAKRIDQLEAATGTRLFQRTTRSMQLSEAGQD